MHGENNRQQQMKQAAALQALGEQHIIEFFGLHKGGRPSGLGTCGLQGPQGGLFLDANLIFQSCSISQFSGFVICFSWVAKSVG